MGAPTANGSASVLQNGTPPASASWSVEVVYRGIFQKRLANRISRGVVLGARKEGKVGTAFARYGDSPERNGIPAKNFAVVATDEVELESSLARYEPENVDVSIVVDDTMCKGVESWAWYGIQPINKLVVPGGWLVVTSDKEPDELLKVIKVKPYDYNLAVVPSPPTDGELRRTVGRQRRQHRLQLPGRDCADRAADPVAGVGAQHRARADQR